MEVHAHTHSPRKKWIHYFWEFLMLFLAVFCGFLAENQREHYVEHLREKQYIRTFIADLKDDTAQTKIFIPLLRNTINGLDSLMISLKTPDAMQNPFGIYRFTCYPKEDIRFIHANRTMEQVKNSGNMRLIRKSIVSDSLMKYDHFIQYASTRYQIVSDMQKEVLSLMDEIFDESYNLAAENNPASVKHFSLLIKDNHKLDILYNKLSRLRQLEKTYNDALTYINYFGSRLIRLLQKEYHLK